MIYILIPISMLLLIIAYWIFQWAVNNGQYEDLNTPAHQIIFDDQEKRSHEHDRK